MRPPTSARVQRAGSTFAADAGACVRRVDPIDGSTGIFRDALVVLHVSHPLDEASLDARAFSVWDPEGPVPGSLSLTGSGDVLVWTGARPLRADALHVVLARGLRDAAGRELPEHCSRFVPCALALEDLRG